MATASYQSVGEGFYPGPQAQQQPTPHVVPQITPQPTGGAQNKWAAVLFWIHVIVVLIIAFALGPAAVRADNSAGDNNRATFDFNSGLFLRMMTAAVGVGLVISVIVFYALHRIGAALIKVGLFLSLVFQVVMAIVLFVTAPIAGAMMIICAAITAVYIYFVRKRIPFAAAHLSVASAAVKEYRSVFLFALVMLFVQGLWLLMWGLAALGIQHRINAGGDSSSTSNSSKASGGAIVFFLLVSLFWGALLFAAVVHFVTAAVVGHWWFSPTPTSVVRGSIKRAFTTSFGSLAFGCLVVAIIRALSAMARGAQRRAQSRRNIGVAILACVAHCILRIAGDIMEYFNQWAFIYCALQGTDFVTSGKSALALFKDRGWTTVINDDLTSVALNIMSLMVGAICAAIGAGGAFAATAGHQNKVSIGVVAFLCFIVGFMMASIMAGVLKSAVRAVFVCFAMNPQALQQTHPEHLAALVAAWQQFHAQEFTTCGYAAQFAPGGSVGGAGGNAGGSVTVPIGAEQMQQQPIAYGVSPYAAAPQYGAQYQTAAQYAAPLPYGAQYGAAPQQPIPSSSGSEFDKPGVTYASMYPSAAPQQQPQQPQAYMPAPYPAYPTAPDPTAPMGTAPQAAPTWYPPHQPAAYPAQQPVVYQAQTQDPTTQSAYPGYQSNPSGGTGGYI